jgi:hypothetical protein
MTTIVYNNVIMRDCETKGFSQSVEYDPSNTDVIYSKFTISVASTLVATSYPKQSFGITPLPDGAADGTVAARAKQTFALLSEARKDFWMLIEGQTGNERISIDGPAGTTEALLIGTGELQASSGGAGTIARNPLDSSAGFVSRATVIDVNNGPQPKNVQITEIIGGRSFRVEFEIEVNRKICIPGFVDAPPNAPGGVVTADNRIVSNRWSLEESKDENWITTKSMQGTLRVAHTSYWPHAMRLLCVPTLLNGYKRIRQSFNDDPTGLILKYRIEDQQAYAAPPYPAVSWKGHHAETMSGPNGSIFGGEFSITLRGAMGVDKVLLIGAAGKVAVDRLKGLVPPFDANGKRTEYTTILKNASIINMLDEPAIQMRVQVQYTDPNPAKALTLRLREMGKPLTTIAQGTDPRYAIEGYDPNKWPVPLPYDSASPAGVFSCYLQHPCSVWHDMPGGLPPGGPGITPPQRKPGTPSGEPDEPETTGSSGNLVIPNDPASGLKAANDIYTFPYNYVDMSSRYQINNGWIQLPLANVESNAPKTASLIKLHGNVAKRILTVTASRDGRQPKIPILVEETTDHNGIREVLEKWWIEGKAPELLAGGQGRRFAVQVQYVYLLERAPRIDEKLRVGSTQIDKILPAENWMDLDQMQDEEGLMQTPSDPPSLPSP